MVYTSPIKQASDGIARKDMMTTLQELKNTVVIPSATIQEYVDTIKSLDIKVEQFSDYQVVVGYRSGEVARTQTIVGGLRDVAFDDVIFYDIRPYGYMNEPSKRIVAVQPLDGDMEVDKTWGLWGDEMDAIEFETESNLDLTRGM